MAALQGHHDCSGRNCWVEICWVDSCAKHFCNASSPTNSVTGLAAPCSHHLLDNTVPSRSSRQIVILWRSACRCLQPQLRALQPRRTLQRPPCSRRLLAQPSRFPAQPTMVSESRGCRRASARRPAGTDASGLRSCADSSMFIRARGWCCSACNAAGASWRSPAGSQPGLQWHQRAGLPLRSARRPAGTGALSLRERRGQSADT